MTQILKNRTEASNGRVSQDAKGVGAYCQERVRVGEANGRAQGKATGVRRDCLKCILLCSMQRPSEKRRHGR